MEELKNLYREKDGVKTFYRSHRLKCPSELSIICSGVFWNFLRFLFLAMKSFHRKEDLVYSFQFLLELQ